MSPPLNRPTPTSAAPRPFHPVRAPRPGAGLPSHRVCAACTRTVTHDPALDLHPPQPFECLRCRARNPKGDYVRQRELIRAEAAAHRAWFYESGNTGVGEGPRGDGYMDMEQVEAWENARGREMVMKAEEEVGRIAVADMGISFGRRAETGGGRGGGG